jgi:hypothetical protein
VVATVQNRVQLLSLELQEERSWYFHTVVIAAGRFSLPGCAVVVGTIAIVIFCRNRRASYVMAGFAVLYVALAVALGLTLRKRTEEKTSRPEGNGRTIDKGHRMFGFMRMRHFAERKRELLLESDINREVLHLEWCRFEMSVRQTREHSTRNIWTWGRARGRRFSWRDD